MSSELAEEYLELKEEIKNIEHEKSKLEGRLQSAMEKLKLEYDEEDIAKATNRLEDLKEEKEELEKELKDKMNKFRAKKEGI